MSLIGLDPELIAVAPGANREPDYLKINRFGQVPVLIDGDVTIADSNAILVYLAKKHGKTDWLPEDAAGAAAVRNGSPWPQMKSRTDPALPALSPFSRRHSAPSR